MMVVDIPYGEIVVSVEDGVALAKIFEKSERYEDKYRSGGDNTRHVYTNDRKMKMYIISDDLYRMAKLAGKPED